jgi:hyperosmotically inducible protein
MRRTHLFLLLLLAAAPMLDAQTFDALMNKAGEADLRGKTTLAARYYREAAEKATAAPDRITALLKFVDAVRGGEMNAKLDEAAATEIGNAYQRALSESSGAESFKVHNDYGVFLLDRQNAPEAVKVFEAGRDELDAVGPRVAARYLQNYGLAQVRTQHVDEALTTFWTALDKDPSLSLTADAAVSILRGFPADRGSMLAVERLQRLLDANSLDAAERLLISVMDSDAWHDQPQAMALLPELFVTFAIRNDTPYSTIVKEWLPRLDHLRFELQNEPRNKVEQLLLVFEGKDLPMSFDGDVERHFSLWTEPEQRRNLSRLLRQTGDAMVDREPKRAAERYIAAWKLDRNNVDALTSLANLLAEWDDEKVPMLLGQLVDNAWDAKLGAIASGDDAAELRLHMVLGAIFDRQGKFEPSTDPRTSSFQYAAALAAYERLRLKPDAPVYPGVYSNAALSFKRLGKTAEAWHAYVSAADANLHTGDVESAARMLERCDELGYEPGDVDQERMRALRTAIDEQTRTPVTDSGIAAVVRDRLSADPEIDASKLEVNVQQGNVLLKGEVGTQKEIDEAKVAVQKTDGVKDVRVEVTLTPPIQ